VTADGSVRVTVSGSAGIAVDAALDGGEASVELPVLAKGRYRITVDYLGNGNFSGSSATTTLSVTG
jgi:uncharacterized protein YfaP (DUF2135 family)